MVALTNLFDPGPAFEGSVHDALIRLRNAGVLAKRDWPATPELLAVRDNVMALRKRWDDALASRIFRGDVGGFLVEFRQGFIDDKRAFGECRVAATRTSGPRRIEWDLACDRGEQGWEVELDDDGHIDWIRPDDRWMSDPHLEKLAAPVAGLLARWDDGSSTPTSWRLSRATA
jgi:hypothetical protein